jgi:hypothetical protein
MIELTDTMADFSQPVKMGFLERLQRKLIPRKEVKNGPDPFIFSD